MLRLHRVTLEMPEMVLRVKVHPYTREFDVIPAKGSSLLAKYYVLHESA
jgi:hypothetical protein